MARPVDYPTKRHHRLRIASTVGGIEADIGRKPKDSALRSAGAGYAYEKAEVSKMASSRKGTDLSN